MTASATVAQQMQTQTVPTAGPGLSLAGVGVRYKLLTEDQRTLKGRVLNAFNGSSRAAEFWAVENVSCEIKGGEIVGVVGRNGSGKSTLLRVMARIIEPSTGEVSVQGRVSPMLELGGAFNGDLTGRENCYLNGAIYKMSRPEVDEMIPSILSFSELGIFFDMPVKSYSSGMISRLAFALSTQVHPEILLLDEVLAVGDEAFQKKCTMRMRKMLDSGSIVILVSHSSAAIEQLCNRAIYLSKGKLIADGKPRQVIAQYQKESVAGL